MSLKSLGKLFFELSAKTDDLKRAEKEVDAFTKHTKKSAERINDAAKNAEGLARAEKRAAEQAKKLADESNKTNDYAEANRGLGVMHGKLGMILGTLGSIAGIGAFASQTSQVLAYAKELDIYSDALDVNSQKLQSWQIAAGGLIDVPDVLKDVKEKLGDLVAADGGEAKDIFERLKLNVEDLMASDPTDVLIKIKNRIDDLGNVSRNEEIFLFESLGNDLTKILPLLDDGQKKLKAIQAETDKSFVIFGDDQLGQLKQANDDMRRMKTSMQGVGNQLGVMGSLFVTAFADPISDGLNTLAGNLAETYSYWEDGFAAISAANQNESASMAQSMLENNSLYNQGVQNNNQATFDAWGFLWRNLPLIAEQYMHVLKAQDERDLLALQNHWASFSESTELVWQNVKYAGEAAWIYMSNAGATAIAGMVNTTADGVGLIAEAFAFIDDDMGNKVKSAEARLRKYASNTSAIRDKELAAAKKLHEYEKAKISNGYANEGIVRNKKGAEEATRAADKLLTIQQAINANEIRHNESVALGLTLEKRLENNRKESAEKQLERQKKLAASLDAFKKRQQASSSPKKKAGKSGKSQAQKAAERERIRAEKAAKREQDRQDKADRDAFKKLQDHNAKMAEEKKAAAEDRLQRAQSAQDGLESLLLTDREKELKSYRDSLEDLNTVFAQSNNKKLIGMASHHELAQRLEAQHQKKLKEITDEEQNRDQAQSNIDSLVGGLSGFDLEKENKRYAEAQSAFVKAKELNLETLVPYHEIERQLNEEHSANVIAIKRAEYEQLSTMQKAMMLAGRDLGSKHDQAEFRRQEDVFKNNLGAAAQYSKEAFALNKAYKMAQLLIDAPAAISASYAYGATLGGGPITGAIFAGVAAAAIGVQAGALASAKFSGRQFGGSTNRHSGYEINESGVPEVYTQDGKDYMLTGSERGNVTPLDKFFNQQTTINNNNNNGGGGAVVIENKINVINASGASVERRVDENNEEVLFIADIEGGGDRAIKLEETYGLRRVGT